MSAQLEKPLKRGERGPYQERLDVEAPPLGVTLVTVPQLNELAQPVQVGLRNNDAAHERLRQRPAVRPSTPGRGADARRP